MKEKLKGIKKLFSWKNKEFDKGIEEIIALIKGLDFDDDDDLEVLQEVILIPLSHENYTSYIMIESDDVNSYERTITITDKNEYDVSLEDIKEWALKFVLALAENDFDFSVVFPGKVGLAVLFADKHCKGGVKTFNAMVKSGADPFLSNAKGENALHLFTQRYCTDNNRESFNEVAEIINSFDDISEWLTHSELGATPLHMAVFNRNYILIESILSKNIDPDITGARSVCHNHIIDTFDGVTPFHLACYIGDTKSAEMLLKAGAKEDIKDTKGNVACHYVVSGKFGHYESGSEKLAILRNLTCINTTNDDGITPLVKYFTSYDANTFDFGAKMIATGSVLIEMGSVLLEKGADPNMASNQGISPLMAAVEGHHLAGVKNLVKAGAKVNYIGEAGNTALHIAVRWGDNTKIARYLIKKGGDANIPNNDGETVSERASKKNMTEILELLIEEGFKDVT